jgi:hypothetical protein
MSWEQMREMAEHGATFANHGASHQSMIAMQGGEDEQAQKARVRADIDTAWNRLDEELEALPGLFAYPYGEYDETAAEVIAELGLVAFGQHSGAIGPTSDRRALARFPINEAYSDLADFRLKIATRPLPVTKVDPWNPTTASHRPRLEITLGLSDARLADLACFVGGQGQVEIQWLEPGHRFAIQPAKPLSDGRNRVNCTAPAKDSGRFHWFSHQWIIRTE